MKKKLFFIFILLLSLFTTGCLKIDTMEDINIITTIYPIEYITNRLYGNHSTIKSIYPRGIYIPDYKLTNKQIKDFSNYDLFIYNGSSNEKEYATQMLNKNTNLKIIDAAYSLEETDTSSDIWLNPSNMLMLAQNIRNEFEEYVNNPYIVDEIKENYENLKLDISALETELKKSADNSIDKRIICADSSLNFLEKYGFEIINLSSKGQKDENNIALAKNLINNKKLEYIFITEETKELGFVKTLSEQTKASTLTIERLENISEDNIKNSNDYLSIMYENLEQIKKETYK